MEKNHDEIKQHLSKILNQAELAIPANSNRRTLFPLQHHFFVFAFVFTVVVLFIMYHLNLTEPVSAISVNQIDNLAKSVAACQNRSTASYKAELKKRFNIYDFDNIDKNMAEDIIKYLQLNLCESETLK